MDRPTDPFPSPSSAKPRGWLETGNGTSVCIMEISDTNLPPLLPRELVAEYLPAHHRLEKNLYQDRGMYRVVWKHTERY